MLSKLPTNLPSHLTLKFIKLYLNFGDLQRARHVFEEIPDPDIRTWTLLISAYTKWGLPRESLKLYLELRNKKIKPDKLVLLSVVKACTTLSDLIKAKEIHNDAVTFGFGSDLVLGNALIDMYGKCNCIQGAQKVFDDLIIKDVISWTSIAASYSTCGLQREALRVLHEMVFSGVRPNSVTVSSILPACSDLKALHVGREIHGFAVRNGMANNVFVSSGLVDMYAKCLSSQQARIVFDNMPRRDVVSWNVILTTYFSTGNWGEALKLFDQMKIEGAKANLASWNAVIGGCAENGLNEQAFDSLARMQDSGFKPNQITIASIFPACTNLESLRGGKEMHGYSLRHCYMEDAVIATALVFMYAKCGDLVISRRTFEKIPRKDIVSWNTIILANSMHGHGHEALALFCGMVDSGIKPNSITFMAVLSGCSHSQLVEEGLSIFNSMSRDHGLEPDENHYSCMVDVFSRAGRLEEAYGFIHKMPLKPTAGAWGALLGACRVYKNVELGVIAAQHLFEIEPDNPGNYVLLSNILVAAKLQDDASKTRKLMRDRGVRKMPGCSWIQVKDKVYTFTAGDKRSPQSDQIYGFLDELYEKMKSLGYVPNSDYALQDVNEEEKEEGLGFHSERLAVAFGILNLKGASTIRIFKNLRICGDCHNAIKFIAKIVGVQIIVRDSMRFHHFRDGLCSCHDFW